MKTGDSPTLKTPETYRGKDGDQVLKVLRVPPPPVAEKNFSPFKDDDRLSTWLQRVRQAATVDAVLDIVNAFRPLEWTDQERARMSQAYVSRIETLHPPSVVAREPLQRAREDVG
ncbi:MAG TPA: hypothetical protein V6D08_19485 [Candidatus Obscuribacterales bacterium]